MDPFSAGTKASRTVDAWNDGSTVVARVAVYMPIYTYIFLQIFTVAPSSDKLYISHFYNRWWERRPWARSLNRTRIKSEFSPYIH
jgi:hypothetical protein